jgi:hypothetical protein
VWDRRPDPAGAGHRYIRCSPVVRWRSGRTFVIQVTSTAAVCAGQTPVMCSGRMGTRRSGLPHAARTAAATAGPEEMVGGSPTPRTP